MVQEQLADQVGCQCSVPGDHDAVSAAARRSSVPRRRVYAPLRSGHQKAAPAADSIDLIRLLILKNCEQNSATSKLHFNNFGEARGQIVGFFLNYTLTCSNGNFPEAQGRTPPDVC